MKRAIVVGAKRRRQGVGEFTARYLNDAGVEIAGIVGTSEDTVAEAQRTLDEYGIRSRGYTSLESALAKERPDIVAICSPYTVHRSQLDMVARAGAHCLCEKPLWWDGNVGNVRAVTEALVDEFAKRSLLLDQITQWPFTLNAFEALHGNTAKESLRTFEMILSPVCHGEAMIPDAVPHVWSLLYALAGNGEVQDTAASYPDGSDQNMLLQFRYRHTAGDAAVSCRFVTTPERPRPAAYAINGKWIHRRIQLPEYEMHFECDGRTVRPEDPLKLLVRDFVCRVTAGDSTNVPKLVAAMMTLEAVVASRGVAAGKV
jgi:hypothetical protein